MNPPSGRLAVISDNPESSCLSESAGAPEIRLTCLINDGLDRMPRYPRASLPRSIVIHYPQGTAPAASNIVSRASLRYRIAFGPVPQTYPSIAVA